MGCVAAKVARPEFGRGLGGTVNYKLISGFVEGSSGLELGDVRSVTELSLSVTSQNLMGLEEGHPVVFLFLVGHDIDNGWEHGVVETDTGQKSLDIVGPGDVGVLIDLVVEVELGVVDVKES